MSTILEKIFGTIRPPVSLATVASDLAKKKRAAEQKFRAEGYSRKEASHLVYEMFRKTS